MGEALPHLVHVSQPTEAGVAVCVHKLTRAAIDAGFRVTVACPVGGKLADWIQGEGAQWIPMPMQRSPRIGELGMLPALRRLAHSADIVHMHSSKASALGRLALAGMSQSPLRVVTPHGWSWYVGGRAAPAYRAFERLAMRWTDIVTVVSKHELEEGRHVLGRRGSRLMLIENGVDTHTFTPDGPVATRDDRPLVVCVGRLSWQKGQDLLLKEFAMMERRDSRLRLVGAGPSMGDLVALAAELDVSDRVEFVGACDPRPHLRAADVVVVPSRWEGMSLLLLEAMACGASIVSTDSGGSDALGETGVVVSLNSLPGGIASQVDALLVDTKRRVALAADARRRVVEKFDQQRVFEAYQDLWRNYGAQSLNFPS